MTSPDGDQKRAITIAMATEGLPSWHPSSPVTPTSPAPCHPSRSPATHQAPGQGQQETPQRPSSSCSRVPAHSALLPSCPLT